jgi:murein endopeptidase
VSGVLARTGLALVLLALVPASADAACHSQALGLTNNGRLACGVQLPAETDALVTWDGVLGRSPNRGSRRWGTQKLVDTVERLSIDYGVRFPIGPRLVVADMSRRHGGQFGREFGGVGHASHQNGLDVDVYYPRRDGLEMPPEKPSLIDRRRAQWLVNRVAHTARFVFIGPNTGLAPPNRRVQYLPSYHDNHFHLRIWP